MSHGEDKLGHDIYPLMRPSELAFGALGIQEQHLTPFGCTSRKEELRAHSVSVNNKLRQKEPFSRHTSPEVLYLNA